MSTTNTGFFAVDRRAWARVCALGLNPAVAYLVVACGTGGDNRTTKWSDQAIRKYAGLSRGRTDKAMAELKASGLVRNAGKLTKNHYVRLQPRLASPLSASSPSWPRSPSATSARPSTVAAASH